MERLRVKKVYKNKGEGILLNKDGDSIYFSYRDLENSEDLENLEEGQSVKGEVVEDSNGNLIAKNIKL
tara:strand:- start:7256 stop:7459 length:204 start_codon:yes stop_codon:yes gene_type:complete